MTSGSACAKRHKTKIAQYPVHFHTEQNEQLNFNIFSGIVRELKKVAATKLK